MPSGNTPETQQHTVASLSSSLSSSSSRRRVKKPIQLPVHTTAVAKTPRSRREHQDQVQLLT